MRPAYVMCVGCGRPWSTPAAAARCTHQATIPDHEPEYVPQPPSSASRWAWVLLVVFVIFIVVSAAIAIGSWYAQAQPAAPEVFVVTPTPYGFPTPPRVVS